ncbi:MAG: prephenate dehydratase [Parvularcula sp.]|uniref:prephenate dehydratase n=1 Tax=Hyphococcus sp. TaxID=2038636 RepID=UPI000C4F8655|nr:prephenate dehydratase [Parvularcula sp.]
MTDATADKKKRIAYQGEPGAFSELACRRYAPDFEPLPCGAFDEAVEAVTEGRAERAMLPVENSLAGRVGDIHHLLPKAGLHIIAEHFLPVEHHLMAKPGAKFEDIKVARSHPVALAQVRDFLHAHNIRPETAGDTAGAARRLSESSNMNEAVVASVLAAELYGLNILKNNIEDAPHNTTRFLEMAHEPMDASPDDGPVVTSFIFQVRNIPAALYKALGGFATNGVNMTKLESYQLGGSFSATMFYADAEGHPAEEPMRLALEELSFFSSSLKILGVYKKGRERGE